MIPKKGKFYLGWGWGDDDNFEPEMGQFNTYEEALKAAKKSHKEEIAYQKEENGNTYEAMNTYVYFYDGNPCLAAMISGFRGKVTEYEY